MEGVSTFRVYQDLTIRLQDVAGQNKKWLLLTGYKKLQLILSGMLWKFMLSVQYCIVVFPFCLMVEN